MVAFDAQDISLMIMAIQRYKNIQLDSIHKNDYADSELSSRHDRIDHLETLEEKLYEQLDKLENS